MIVLARQPLCPSYAMLCEIVASEREFREAQNLRVLGCGQFGELDVLRDVGRHITPNRDGLCSGEDARREHQFGYPALA
jgi:hypothetical protein